MQSFVTGAYFWMSSKSSVQVGTEWKDHEVIFEVPAPGKPGWNEQMSKFSPRLGWRCDNGTLEVADLQLRRVTPKSEIDALREQGAKRPKKKVLEPYVVDALQRAGLYDEVSSNLDHPALRLSGGQQQRLCIARALAARPEVLLMDEPCSALDPKSTNVIEELIVELRKELAIVIVTHNLQQAYRVGDHVAFMYLGDLVEYGPTDDLFDNPKAARTRDYIGGAFG